MNKKTRKPGVSNQIEVYKIFSAEVVAASGNASSEAIDLHNRTGIFSIQYVVTGLGTCKFEYLVSHDNITFIEPAAASAASDIITGVAASSGFVACTPLLAPYIKIKVTETGGAQAVTVTATIAIQ